MNLRSCLGNKFLSLIPVIICVFHKLCMRTSRPARCSCVWHDGHAGHGTFRWVICRVCTFVETRWFNLFPRTCFTQHSIAIIQTTKITGIIYDICKGRTIWWLEFSFAVNMWSESFDYMQLIPMDVFPILCNTFDWIGTTRLCGKACGVCQRYMSYHTGNRRRTSNCSRIFAKTSVWFAFSSGANLGRFGICRSMLNWIDPNCMK